MAIHTARQGGGFRARTWLWLGLLALLYAATLAGTAWTLGLWIEASPALWAVGLGTALGWGICGALTEYLYQRRPA